MNGTGSFVTLKNHKENFMKHPITRLLNLSKNEVGRISKYIKMELNANFTKRHRIISNLSPTMSM